MIENWVASIESLRNTAVGNTDGSQISCAALRALALNSREQLIREQKEDPEVLEVRNNNLIIWKKGKRITHLISTKCECTIQDNPTRLVRIVMLKCYMMDRGRVTGQVDHTQENPKDLGKPRVRRPIAGPSHQIDTRHGKPPTEGSRQERSRQYDKARETRTSNRTERRPVWSKQATAVRPCPYYLRSRVKQPEGIPEEWRSNGIDSIPQNNIRKRSLSMEALDGDPVDRSE
ncbi:uncharacterized protein TNCV_1573901 [Trichonephila clavipes]|nr:uncharacterized protein TNCV_1573901 [Trichonephila clavipes]